MIIFGSYIADKKCRLESLEMKSRNVPEKFVCNSEDGNGNITLSWDESDWFHDYRTGEGSFRLKGIHANGEYANGYAVPMLSAAVLDSVQIDGEPDANFRLTKLKIRDWEKTISIPEKKLVPNEIVYIE